MSMYIVKRMHLIRANIIKACIHINSIMQSYYIPNVTTTGPTAGLGSCADRATK